MAILISFCRGKTRFLREFPVKNGNINYYNPISNDDVELEFDTSVARLLLKCVHGVTLKFTFLASAYPRNIAIFCQFLFQDTNSWDSPFSVLISGMQNTTWVAELNCFSIANWFFPLFLPEVFIFPLPRFGGGRRSGFLLAHYYIGITLLWWMWFISSIITITAGCWCQQRGERKSNLSLHFSTKQFITLHSSLH